MDRLSLPTSLLPYPLPPWRQNFRSLSVFCEVDEKNLRPFIPAPLKLASNIVQISVMFFNNCDPLRPYYDSGVIALVKYKKISGGYWVFGFTSTDEVLSGVREIWGYNFKLAQKIELEEQEDEIQGFAQRLGKKVIHLKMKPTREKFTPLTTFPRIFLKLIPKADAPEADVRKIIILDAEPESTLISKVGEGSVSLQPSEVDPVYKLNPTKVIGASFTAGYQILPWGRESS